MKTLAGITTGPINDTLSEASTPAALWFASSFFSELTRRICLKLNTSELLSELKIWSPYFTGEKDEEFRRDSAGRYHDRIIFTCASDKETVCSVLKDTVSLVKKEMTGLFPDGMLEDSDRSETEKFLEKYLQIHWIVAEDEESTKSPLLSISSLLDSLELMKTFTQDDLNNPFVRLFSGERNSTNKLIKESSLFTEISSERNQLVSERGDSVSIKSIEEICYNPDSALKRSDYFATVQADCDSVGNFLEALSSGENSISDTLRFSELMSDFSGRASRMIAEFGGMTVYAGGDDLLFLVPLCSGGKTVIDLCTDISAEFREILENEFSDYSVPTISFGVSVNYKKFPLYEARVNAEDLLIKTAKKTAGKNCISLNLRKHSGQSVSVNIPFGCAKIVSGLTVPFAEGGNQSHSLQFALSNNRTAFRILDSEADTIGYESYEKRWDNFFDNAGQQNQSDFIHMICRNHYDFLKANSGQRPFFINQENGSEEYSIDVMKAILKIKAFLSEGGRENDR